MARDVNELILQFKFASANANRQIKKTEKEMGRLRLTTTGLRRSLGAIRNNLLLVSFAAGAVIGSIGKIVSVSAKFEAVKTRLIGLTGSVENAEKAFKNFNDVAATTPFSLDDVVNAGAQLQAFGADAEALIKPITDLAAFMGTTATEAANAFGRAYAGGAGAADILRERGILNIIKTSQGLTDLAKTTLPEFREALIKSLQDPVVGIEGSTERLAKTTTGAISNMGDAFTRLAAAIGDELKPVTDAAISSLTNLAKGATNLISPDVPTKVESMRNELDGLAESLRVNTLASEKHQDSTLNIADAFDIAIARGQAFYAANEDIRHQAPELQAAIIDYNSNIVTQNNLLETNRKKIIARSTALINDLIAMDEYSEVSKVQEEFLRQQKETMTTLVESNDEMLVKMQEIKELNPYESIGNALSVLDHEQKIAIGLTQRLSSSFVQAGIAGQNMGDALITALKSIAVEILAQAAVFGLLKTFFAPGTLSFGFGEFLSKSFGVAHKGGLITNDGVQTFATGGLVRGQDNVPILAQAGEFVMSRDAVNSIGLSNLKDMNQTGRQVGSTINVTIQGGVVDQDYVANTLIPAINSSGQIVA